MQLRHRPLHRSQGTGLLEVMIAVLLLSGGVLAMSLLHANSFKYTKMAQFRGVATQLAFELADRMRANAIGATTGAYTLTATYSSTAPAVTVPACANAAACTALEMAAIDLAEMRNTARQALPGGGLRVTQDAAESNVINVWVIWLDPEAYGNDANSQANVLPCPFTSTPAPQCLPMRIAL